MTTHGVADTTSATPHGRSVRARSTRFVAGALAVGLTAGLVAYSGSTAASAATTYSTTATGRFLSGTIAGLNLDTVAGINGEAAANKFGPTVTNKNSLEAELLSNAIRLPLQNGLQLPGLNILQLGAVQQYASASPDGSALGATGLVSNSGGIGVGGSSGGPASATLDLSGLGGAALAKLLNVKAGIGAVSAGAVEAPAAGSGTADKSCGSSQQVSVKDGAQAGVYCIAGVDLELDVPVLANLLPQLLTPVTTLLDAVNSTLQGLGGLVTIPSLADAITSLEKVSLPATGAGAGAVSLDLTTGTIKVSVAKLLQSLNLDLNELPPNTSLVPYVVKALAGLPTALGNLASDLVTKVDDVVSGITVAGLSASDLKLVLDPLLKGLTGTGGILDTLTKTLTGIVGQLTPITDLLSGLLEIVVNGQSTTNGIFTETAVQLKLGGALSSLNSTVAGIISTLTGLLGGTLPSTVTAQTKQQVATTEGNVAAAANAMPSSSSAKSGSSAHSVRLVSAVRPLAQPRVQAAAAAADPLIQLNLAQAAVGPSAPRTAPTPSPTTSAPPTQLPTGVPAGSGSTGGSPLLPLVFVLIALGLAAGGVTTYRIRGARGLH